MIKKILHYLPYFKNLQVLPGHYYSPVISVDELSQQQDKIWKEPGKALKGIDLNVDAQLKLVEKFLPFYEQIPFKKEQHEAHRYYFKNVMFSYADGIMLYGMMRTFKPKRMIEVGSGFSSALMLDVNNIFFDNKIDLTFIEPYSQRLKSLLRQGEKINLIEKNVQSLDSGLFKDLEENDILFIDSSHVSKTGSDVNFLLFEVLPLLKKGVKVHFHDIFYPFQYPKRWIFEEKRSWNEAYSLRAFLSYNNKFKILLFNTYLEKFYKDWFKENMPMCLLNKGGSIWLDVQ